MSATINLRQAATGVIIALIVSAATSFLTINYQLKKNSNLNIRKEAFFEISELAGQRLQVLNQIHASIKVDDDIEKIRQLKDKSNYLTTEWESKIHQFSALTIVYFSEGLYNSLHNDLNNPLYHAHLRIMKLQPGAKASKLEEIDKLLDKIRDHLITQNINMSKVLI